MKKIIMILFLISTCYSHHEDVHKYIVWNAYQLVIDQHPGSQYTIMHNHLGNWWEGFYNGNGYWGAGYIVTGAYHEDNLDVVYGYTWPNTTSTHFWDPEDYRCDNNPDNTKIKPLDYCYENSYVKSKAYWFGKKHAGQDWLNINVAVLSGPVSPTPDWYNLSMRYDDLGRFYRYNEVYVTRATRLSPPYQTYFFNPPVPLMNFNIQNGTRNFIENVSYEIVGRMCHLLGDAGVPAHAHNDVHGIFEDDFEYFIRPDGFGYFDDRNWTHAKQQAITFGQTPIVDVLNLQGQWGPADNPLRYLLYTTDQIADRLPSNDYDGDASYSSWGPNFDPYYLYMQSIVNSMTSSYDFPSTWDNWAEGLEKPYLYSIRSTAGLLWYVYNKFGIQSTPPPIITGFTQSPPILCRGNYATVTCNLSQGGGLTFQWSEENRPPGMYATFEFNEATLYYNPPVNAGQNSNRDNMTEPPYILHCTASNQYGQSYGNIRVLFKNL